MGLAGHWKYNDELGGAVTSIPVPCPLSPVPAQYGGGGAAEVHRVVTLP